MNKRITPEQVREAFLETGLTPKQGEFLFANKCGCGLGAIWSKMRSDHADEQYKDVEHTLSEWKRGVICEFDLTAHFDKEYGMDYRVGFVQGFDNLPADTENYINHEEKRYNEGFKDGQSAWKAVQDLVPPVTI